MCLNFRKKSKKLSERLYIIMEMQLKKNKILKIGFLNKQNDIKQRRSCRIM